MNQYRIIYYQMKNSHTDQVKQWLTSAVNQQGGHTPTLRQLVPVLGLPNLYCLYQIITHHDINYLVLSPDRSNIIKVNWENPDE